MRESANRKKSFLQLSFQGSLTLFIPLAAPTRTLCGHVTALGMSSRSESGEQTSLVVGAASSELQCRSVAQSIALDAHTGAARR